MAKSKYKTIKVVFKRIQCIHIYHANPSPEIFQSDCQNTDHFKEQSYFHKLLSK